MQSSRSSWPSRSSRPPHRTYSYRASVSHLSHSSWQTKLFSLISSQQMSLMKIHKCRSFSIMSKLETLRLIQIISLIRLAKHSGIINKHWLIVTQCRHVTLPRKEPLQSKQISPDTLRDHPQRRELPLRCSNSKWLQLKYLLHQWGQDLIWILAWLHSS